MVMVFIVFGVFVLFVFGWWVFMVMGYLSREVFVGGVFLIVMSIGLIVRVMMDFGVLRSEVGVVFFSVSVMDDFLGIVFIIFVVGIGSFFELSIKIVVFFIIMGVFGWYFIDYYIRFVERFYVEKGILGMVIGMMFFFVVLVEGWFVVVIEGVFMMGFIFLKFFEGKCIMEDVCVIGYGFLILFFFVYIGVMFNFKVFEYGDVIIFVVVLLVIVIVGKIVGRGFGVWKWYGVGEGIFFLCGRIFGCCFRWV